MVLQSDAIDRRTIYGALKNLSNQGSLKGSSKNLIRCLEEPLIHSSIRHHFWFLKEPIKVSQRTLKQGSLRHHMVPQRTFQTRVL